MNEQLYLIGVRVSKVILVGPFDSRPDALSWLNAWVEKRTPTDGGLFLSDVVWYSSKASHLYRDHFRTKNGAVQTKLKSGFFLLHRTLDEAYLFTGPFSQYADASGYNVYLQQMRGYSVHSVVAHLTTPDEAPRIISPV